MFATACVQPVDMVKVKIQLAGEQAGASRNPFTIAANLIKTDGVGSLYKGLSAGLLRQATYTTARMGLFTTFADSLKDADGKLTFAKRAFAGLAAGGLGSVVGNPCDLALIRMQADAGLPAEKRRNYKNVFDALLRISKEEGVIGLWKGCAPTVARAMALNVGMLATYDQSKDMLTAKFGPGTATNLLSSGVAGFFASFCSLPFDFTKTRMQKQQKLPDGTMPYKNSFDCVAKVIRSEGPLALYSGFLTYYVRIAPHAMITLLTMDFLKSTFA